MEGAFLTIPITKKSSRTNPSESNIYLTPAAYNHSPGLFPHVFPQNAPLGSGAGGAFFKVAGTFLSRRPLLSRDAREVGEVLGAFGGDEYDVFDPEPFAQFRHRQEWNAPG